MRALVAGAAPEAGADAYYAGLLEAAELVIAADAAADWAVQLGRVPDIAIGDFDSSAPGATARLTALGVDVRVYPMQKDQSDLDLAVSAARAVGATAITLTAATSLRLDHTLATLGTLAATADLAGELDEPSMAAWPLDARVRPSLRLSGPPGSVVSVFAVGIATGVSLDGLRYPLTDATLGPFSSHGLSNAMSSETVTIRVSAGRLLVIATGGPGARAVCSPSQT